MYCISISGLSFAVHLSVLSAYCVFILLHCVSLCSVVFLYSLSATFCLPVLTSGPFFQCEVLFLHLYLRRCPHFVEALSLFLLLRLRPHILFWGFVLVLYWRFVLIFYFEASASFFILRLRPHILYWDFALIFYLEALSSYFISRLRPHCFILRLCSSVWGFGPHCWRPLLLCLYCLFGLFAVIMCVVLFVCIFVKGNPPILFGLSFYSHLLPSCNPLFWFTCSYINFNLWFCWLPCFDMCGHYSPVFIVMGHNNVLLYALLSTSHHCF